MNMKTIASVATLAFLFCFSAFADKLKVGFVYIGPVGDHGWTYMHDQGRQAVEKAYGDKVEVTYMESVKYGPDAERAIRGLAKEGMDIIFATSFGYMEPMLKGYELKTAYNEFCYPAIEDAVDELVKENVSEIVIVTTMITRGGSHSENEIPEELQALRLKHPNIEIQYAWPFSMEAFALFLTDHIKTFNPAPSLSSS